MSTYTRETKHPLTGEWEAARWMDDHFGPRHYGVLFSDGHIADPEVVELETRDYDVETLFEPNPRALPEEQLTDIRDLCSYCKRKSPNYCKRHAPTVSVREVKLYTKHDLAQATQQAKAEERERIRNAVARKRHKLGDILLNYYGDEKHQMIGAEAVYRNIEESLKENNQ